MDIETIPLSRLEIDPAATLRECADSGRPFLVELPDRRLIAVQPWTVEGDDDLTSDLLDSNAAFRELVAASAASPRKPFRPQTGTEPSSI